MKKAVLTTIILLTGVSAMAQYYPPPPPPGPVYYPPPHGGGGYHHGGRSSEDEAMSAMSAATGAMFLSLASICSTGPGCYHKVVKQAQEDAVMNKVDGTRTVLLMQAVELLRERAPEGKTEDQLIDSIIDFKAAQ
ncbi:hypothetical protein ACLVWU_02405 [Bdellovibrio sp. HCB290]|uniref:hypothetical protein n=1 Tax=Bdellovibrio sp. HCB290 TaxID=3394356 RepID=UPI0039B50419